jgi:hypothetical protein
MDIIAVLFLAAVGATCIYAGYRLFCDLPAASPGRPTNWAAILLLNVLPGALLAMSGTALLAAEGRLMISHRAAVRHYEPAAEHGTPSGLHRFRTAEGRPFA